jgi:hypothetical protein
MDKKISELFISDFVSFLYRKGYRGRYDLTGEHGAHLRSNAPLTECLKQIVDRSSQAPDGTRYILQTYADPLEKIVCCEFTVSLDDTDGFLIQSVMVSIPSKNIYRPYRLHYNNQVPGAVQACSIQPKERPWDRFLKGRFRP